MANRAIKSVNLARPPLEDFETRLDGDFQGGGGVLCSESGAWTKFLGLFQVEKLKKISLHGGVLGVPACPTFRRDGERDEVLIINNREKPNSPLGSTFQSGGESSARVHLPSQPPRDCYVHCEGEGVRLCTQQSARGRAELDGCFAFPARPAMIGWGGGGLWHFVRQAETAQREKSAVTDQQRFPR